METSKPLKFSEALVRIQEIAESIDRGEVEIDDLAERVKEAYELHALCKKKIEEAELEIQKIIRAQEEERTTIETTALEEDESVDLQDESVDDEEDIPF